MSKVELRSATRILYHDDFLFIMKLHILPQKQIKTRYYVPVVAILAAIATLILLLVVYTSRNLTLARQRLEDSLLQEGIILTQAIEAGSRAGMRMRWRIHQLQTLVEEIGQAPKIVYILVIGADGSILAHTQKEYIEDVSTFNKELFQENQGHLRRELFKSATAQKCLRSFQKLPPNLSDRTLRSLRWACGVECYKSR